MESTSGILSLQLNVFSINSSVTTEPATHWPTDPICGFVAATNISMLHALPQWSCNSSGATDSDPCTWDGITCDQQNQQILSIAIQYNSSLTGTLSPLLGSISTLEYISIYQTGIFGTLPSSWSSLTRLTSLNLYQNSLTGSLPSTWSSLTAMAILQLYQNSLAGILPSSWSSLAAIWTMYLYKNSLSGPLPSSWSSLTKLTSLILTQNSLTGSLPSSWSSLTKMNAIYLDQNSLSGSLPSSWSSLTAMAILHLYQNSFSGLLPSSWSSLKMMRYLDLHQNALSGPLPSTWSLLTRMGYLDLHQNSLSGLLPSSWSSLTRMGYLRLYQNALSGNLPSSWSSLTDIYVLDLFQNSLSGLLPPSWSSLARMEYVDLHQNLLSGPLPSSWSLMLHMYYLYLNDNSLSNSVPYAWRSLSGIRGLSLSGNHLSGPIPSCLDSMPDLQYLYISDNSFSGPLPTTWGSNLLHTIDMSNNAFNGSLHTNVSAYPAVLSWLNAAYNSLSGTVPPAVALFGNISYLNISHNDGIVGSIPIEFCSSTGVSIDVGGTGIDCYSGCLTSSYILVEGASPDCHDGSIMEQFILITGVLAVVAIVFTALYRLHKWWWPIFVSVGSRMSCGCLDCFHLFSWLRYLIFGSCDCNTADGDKRSVSTSNSVSLSYTVFGMAVVKFLLGLVVSLTLNNWWTYSGGHDMARNNDVLASCSNPTVGNCFSYCGDVEVVTVNITTDDVVFDDVYANYPIPHFIGHVQSGSYCIATLPGYCDYEAWVDLKLPPILLQLLGLLLQVILWRFGSDGFSATPQKAQYDLILDQLYPQICLFTATDKTALTEGKSVNFLDATHTSRVALLRQLATPLFPSIFWFLELVTVIYVWGELVFPPVYCGSVPPLSLYYYPILMSLLDLLKLNIYTCVELWQATRHVESIFVLFDFQLFATHLWVTVAMGLIFGAGVIRDCVLGVWWYMEITMGRRTKLKWATESKHTTVEMATPATTANSSSTQSSVITNPILLSVAPNNNDVELAVTGVISTEQQK